MIYGFDTDQAGRQTGIQKIQLGSFNQPPGNSFLVGPEQFDNIAGFKNRKPGFDGILTHPGLIGNRNQNNQLTGPAGTEL